VTEALKKMAVDIITNYRSFSLYIQIEEYKMILLKNKRNIKDDAERMGSTFIRYRNNFSHKTFCFYLFKQYRFDDFYNSKEENNFLRTSSILGASKNKIHLESQALC
jgi:hypothetical protein